MRKMRKIFVAVVALAIVACTFFALAAPAAAATRSNGTKSVTLTVKTKANYLLPGSESVTLSQKKGNTCWTNVITGKKNTGKLYGSWNITVRATDGSHTYTEDWNDGSITLKLKPNKTYKITVTWDTSDNNYRLFLNGKGSFTSYPTWNVKSTWKVTHCA